MEKRKRTGEEDVVCIILCRCSFCVVAITTFPSWPAYKYKQKRHVSQMPRCVSGRFSRPSRSRNFLCVFNSVLFISLCASFRMDGEGRRRSTVYTFASYPYREVDGGRRCRGIGRSACRDGMHVCTVCICH